MSQERARKSLVEEIIVKIAVSVTYQTSPKQLPAKFEPSTASVLRKKYIIRSESEEETSKIDLLLIACKVTVGIFCWGASQSGKRHCLQNGYLSITAISLFQDEWGPNQEAANSFNFRGTLCSMKLSSMILLGINWH